MELIAIIIIAIPLLVLYATHDKSNKRPTVTRRKADAMVDILKNVQSRLTSEGSTGFTEYASIENLSNELAADIDEIEKGNIRLLKKYKIMFAPTGTFQEIAMANDWHDDYMKLADDFDNIYEK